MIISDLNYLEAAQETVVGGTSFNFSKNINAKVNTDASTSFDSDTTVSYYKNALVKAKSDVSGNLASVTFSNEAYGKNTDTEVSVTQVVVEGYGSSQEGTISAAANK
ncbi:MAG: hypothetical protein ACREPR_11865 [Brasilonema sp.]